MVNINLYRVAIACVCLAAVTPVLLLIYAEVSWRRYTNRRNKERLPSRPPLRVLTDKSYDADRPWT